MLHRGQAALAFCVLLAFSVMLGCFNPPKEADITELIRAKEREVNLGVGYLYGFAVAESIAGKNNPKHIVAACKTLRDADRINGAGDRSYIDGFNGMTELRIACKEAQ